MLFVRTVIGFAIAVAATACLGSIASTHFVLAALIKAGAVVGDAERLAMTQADLVGFAPTYAGLVGIAFFLGFAVAWLFAKASRWPRYLVFAAAGAVAMATMLVLAKSVFWGVSPVGGARTLAGLAAQAGIGVIGGLAFALIAGAARPYRYRPR